jgi:ABC-type Mn2+/Zn2+ transport system ATPase subunit
VLFRSTRDALDGVLDQLKAEGRTAVVATHDLDGFQTDFDRAIYLDEGRVVDVPAYGRGGHE